jgi:hypothetical protein
MPVVGSGDTRPVVDAFIKRLEKLADHGGNPIMILDVPPPPSKLATSDWCRA